MRNTIIKLTVRTWFALMSRHRAALRICKQHDNYRALANMINPVSGAKSITVPRMAGVDEDMRNWSFFMILEHNTIVNRSITATVASLVRGEEPTGAGAIDIKKDVMPSERPGEEQIDFFDTSVQEHLNVVAGLGRLRGSLTKQHPIFGEFDAHRWHCMFGFHLFLHYRQAQYLVRKLSAEQAMDSTVKPL